MRRKNLFLFGSLLLLSWVLILSYLFVHQPMTRVFDNFRRNKDVNSEVMLLESSIKDQIRTNERLLFKLKILERKIQETGKGVDQLFEEDPKLLKDSPNSQTILTDIHLNHPVICVLVFACNRVTVRRNLDQLIKYRPENLTEYFPIVVSQDCSHAPTKKTVLSYGNQLRLIEQPDKSEFPLVGKEKKFKGYYKIARHYKWALDQVFQVFNYETVIIVEDDLDISPDFFEYFRSLYPILKADSSLWCVSAWNDNGKEALVHNPETLFRSDFFPGLGWMLTKDLWSELTVKWPKAFWDDWIRQPAQRKERACIRPEVSRTKTFGKIGVSNGLFYEKHLKFIKLNEQFVPFAQRNLSYLLKENYDDSFLKIVYSSPVIIIPDLVQGKLSQESSVRVTYRNKDQFKKFAKSLGLMDDFKSGVPRTGYRGIVSVLYRKRRVFLAPTSDWKGYDLSWT